MQRYQQWATVREKCGNDIKKCTASCTRLDYSVGGLTAWRTRVTTEAQMHDDDDDDADDVVSCRLLAVDR